MENPKVSIIVAVYNAEPYLARCLNSLLAQSFPDFEIVLVDDGSSDRSGKLCDEYVNKDNRINVIHQSNTGVSLARQKGIDNALGDFVIHADPDDWVEPDMLQQLYNKAMTENADMVICDYYSHYGEYVVYNRQEPSSLDHDVVLCELFQQLHGSCCNKLVRRACYNEFNIRFPEGVSYCEDLLTNAMLLTHNIKVAYLPQAFYHYDQSVNPNSLVKRYSIGDFVKNEQLFKLISQALDGTKAESIGKKSVANSLLLRAFRGHIFNNKEFREHCYKYKDFCFAERFSLMSLYLYISCKGGYKFVYSVWNKTHTIKSQIKKISNYLHVKKSVNCIKYL